MRPDVVQTSALVATALEPAIGRDWSVNAGSLEWSVEFTIEHISAALSKYTLYLASRSTESIAVRIVSRRDATQQERLDAIPRLAQGLANVAATTPTGVRVFHASGLTDADGYVAMGCVEVLLHGYDIASGLEIPFDPGDEIVQPVVARLAPWLEATWESLLRYTRIENQDDSWVLLKKPLGEWDGTIPGS